MSTSSNADSSSDRSSAEGDRSGGSSTSQSRSHGDAASASSSDVPSEWNEAFDSKTRKINWDCKCLDGFRDKPCFQQFGHTLQCFVDLDVQAEAAEARGEEFEPPANICEEPIRVWQSCLAEQGPEFWDDMLKEAAAGIETAIDTALETAPETREAPKTEAAASAASASP